MQMETEHASGELETAVCNAHGRRGIT